MRVEGAWEGAAAGLQELSSFNVTASPGLAGWLAEREVALAFTTGDRLMLVGRDRDGRPRVRDHRFGATAGVAAVSPRTLLLASDWQLWRLDDALAEGERDDAGHDRLFLPQSAWTTGFVGAWDVAAGAGGRPLFVSSVCNCVATVSPRLSFTVVWKPPFVSALGGGDRCHLTGLALGGDGEPAYVTAAAATDAPGAWEAPAAVRDGGVVVDARAGEIVAAGLSLPHSPRLWGERLLVAAAGSGELVALDPRDGSREVVARVPALARGLTLVGDRWAVLGCSRIPSDGPYAAAPVAERGPGFHGLAIVDLERGAVAERIELHAASGETIAVAALERTANPDAAAQPGGAAERVAVAPRAARRAAR